MGTVIPRRFFVRPAVEVARDLLGKLIVRNIDGTRLSGMISETEAYVGPEDSACHASKGKTPRTEVMFGEAGCAYIYLVYGLHNMLNIVTGPEGFPAAVLIRELQPIEGVSIMRQLRGRPNKLTDGPGKLCQALSIGRELNGLDMTTRGPLVVEFYRDIPEDKAGNFRRIGIDYAEPEDRDALYRCRVIE